MRKVVCLIAWLVLGAGMARANPIIYLTLDSNYPNDYAFYTYTDTSGVLHTNVPIGPYIGYLNGGGYNNLLVYGFCYDLDSPTYVGTQYSGTIQPYDPSDLTSSEEASYLVNELQLLGGVTAPLAIRGAISMAIWEIMNASSHTKMTPFPSDPAAQPYEAQAAAAVADGLWTSADTAMFPIWIPQNTSIQRFGLILSAEPASLAMVILGIAGIAVLAGWRKAKGLTAGP